MTYVKFGRLIEEDTWNPKEIEKKAIMFDEADIGKLKICSNESILHYLCKAILVFYLKRLHHRVVTEAVLVDIGKMDVLDLDTNTNYELESEKSIANTMRKKEKYLQAGIDLVVIRLPTYTTDIGEITEYVKRYIRPD